MLIAGPIELSQGEILLILGVLAAFALVLLLIGALTAWIISRRRAAIPLGALAIAVFGLPITTVLGPDLGLAAGWLASAAVGVALAPRAHGDDDRSMEHRTGRGRA